MRRARRQTVLLLIGLCVVLFAGYAITLRGRRLQPRKVITLLGEKRLLPGKPAAFRLVGWDLEWERPLRISRVDLNLLRPPGTKAVLARRRPDLPVVDLNLRLPGWPAGPAVIRARVDTEQGETVLEAPVELDPGGRVRLRLLPPSAELERAPVFIRQGAGAAVEGASEGGAPAGVVFFPLGGSLSGSFPTRVLVRVVDRDRKPVAGALQINQREVSPADRDGFFEVVVREGGAPGRLKLSVKGTGGSLDGQAWLHSTPSQIDAAVGGLRVQAGGPLAVRLRTLSDSAGLHLDAWWSGGWFFSGRTRTEGGHQVVAVEVPPEIEGPVVIRARGDPFGQGSAVRDVRVLAGRGRPPSRAEGLAMLRKLPADEGFWDQVGDAGGGARGLQALLSRVRAPEGPLPELCDSRADEQEAVAGRRREVIAFGRGMAVATSAVIWLVVAGLLLRAVRRTQKEQRRSSLIAALGALLVCGIALGCGVFWLFLLEA